MKTKVLVVDDTIFYRKIIKDILEALPDVEVVGTANNGKIALNRIKGLKPDLITLDVEMPEMNGLETLMQIQDQGFDVDCIMVSSLTEKDGEVTIKALELGAIDFITKPDFDSREENIRELQRMLSSKIRIFNRRREMKYAFKGLKVPGVKPQKEKSEDLQQILSRSKQAEGRTEKSDIVGIGISTGGPNALSRILPEFPKDIAVPILIVQHMPRVFTSSLAKSLDAKSEIKIKEAQNGEILQPGCIYLAPGGMQMKIATTADPESNMIRITDDPPENNCKPSVDYLFRSIGKHYGSKATCVIMTGMGSDGKKGVKMMKDAGAICIAQNASTCTVYGMPKAIVDGGMADIIAPLEQIPREIMNTVK